MKALEAELHLDKAMLESALDDIEEEYSKKASVAGTLRAMQMAIGHIQTAGGETQGMIRYSDHGVQYVSRAH